MNEPRRLGRSKIALLAGLVFVVATSLGTDVLMHGAASFQRGGQPMSGPLFPLATIYRAIHPLSAVTSRHR